MDPRDTRWQSYTHAVAGRTFAVWDITEWHGHTMSCSRELVEPATGEVIKTWKPAMHSPLAPYDFAKTQAQLEALYNSPTYGINASQNVAGAVYASSTANWSISTSTTNYINTAVSAPAATTDQQKEHDMAQRQDFTFPYTGTEIADALGRKIQRLTDKVTALHSLDSSALSLLHDVERNTDLSKKVEREIKSLQDGVERLVKERAPYAKAGKTSFDIDLEDIEHFGLNEDDEAPRKVRKPRAAKVESEAVAG